jgi:hypothetical protein
MMVDILRLSNAMIKYAETWINYLPETFYKWHLSAIELKLWVFERAQGL